ncbi:MAG: serine hydrolase domain-containing protein [Pseudomonadota bacterium]
MDDIDNFSGFTTPDFAPLKDVFRYNFTDDEELGASLAVYKDGQLVASLSGGWGNPEKTVPWTQSAAICTMSAVKGPTSLCMHLLLDRGRLHLDQPVADVWPDFAKHGKEAITVGNVLTHQAGLPSLPDAPIGCAYNWEVIIKAFEDQAPLIEPGTTPAYHAHTYGYLAGEIIRRVTGLMPADYFAAEISGPFDIDYELKWRPKFQGRTYELIPSFMPPAEQLHHMSEYFESLFVGEDWKPKISRILLPHFDTSSAPWRTFENPAAFGHGSAKGLAKLYAILAGGGALGGQRLVSEAAVKRMQQQCWHEKEATTNGHWRYGYGFMQDVEGLMMCGPGGFGHPGNGGATGFANPDLGLSFGYVMNKRYVGTDGMANCGPRSARLSEKALEIAAALT